MTNRLDLIAARYRHRWQVELFFKWIKQHLKMKTFYGTLKKALIQVWTALIAYLLLFWLKPGSTVGRGLLAVTRLVQTMLMERCRLWDLLCPRQQAPPQLFLFSPEAGV